MTKLSRRQKQRQEFRLTDRRALRSLLKAGAVFLCLYPLAYLHLAIFKPSGHDHDEHEETSTVHLDELTAAQLQSFSQSYEAEVRDVFAHSCLPCHGEEAPDTLFLRIVADGETRRDARDALAMSNAFPFDDPKSPARQLSLLRGSVGGSMPPRYFSTLIPSRALRPARLPAIRRWLWPSPANPAQ